MSKQDFYNPTRWHLSGYQRRYKRTGIGWCRHNNLNILKECTERFRCHPVFIASTAQLVRLV